MPFIHVLVGALGSQDLTARLAAAVQKLTCTHLNKDPALIAVAIQYIAPDQWYVGGQSLAAPNRTSAWLDIKITDATNTKLEMATYIAAVFAAFTDLLGPLHPASYVLVHPVPASAYGYGGQTQERRYVLGAA
jgi:4-oxalocrotonate tautomerase